MITTTEFPTERVAEKNNGEWIHYLNNAQYDTKIPIYLYFIRRHGVIYWLKIHPYRIYPDFARLYKIDGTAEKGHETLDTMWSISPVVDELMTVGTNWIEMLDRAKQTKP